MGIPHFDFNHGGKENLPFLIERLEASSGYNPENPHRHNFYELFFFSKGGGVHMIDFEEIEIKKKHVHLVQPNQVHYMKRDRGSEGLVVKFPRSLFFSDQNNSKFLSHIDFINDKSLSPQMSLSTEGFIKVSEILSYIQKEIEQKQDGFNYMIMHYWGLILLICHRSYPYPERHKKNSLELQLFIDFQKILEVHYKTESRVSFYQQQLGASADKLNTVIKNNTGKTASELIADRLVLEAKRLLLHANFHVKEIAYQLNFSDEAYFNRWFKKLVNSSPGAFRKLNREKYNR